MALATRDFGRSIAGDNRAESKHALDSFFTPESIAIIGASPDATKIRGLLQSMLQKNGYPGALYPVNPNYNEIAGVPCFPSVGVIGKSIDLALVVIPAARVLPALEECARAHVRHAIIISSGFAEEGGDSAAMQRNIAALARRTGMRISGPNAEGFHNEVGRVAATFSPAVDVKSGAVRHVVSARRVGIVAQSGGMGFALYNRGKAMGLSFSNIITTGNECDLGASDFLEYMVHDADTAVIILFLESVRDPQTFVAAAMQAARIGKPIVVSKVGQSGAGQRAAASHTASMTGWNAAYKAAFAKYGLIEADDPDEAVSIAAALASAPLPKGDRAAIITVSGGAGAWAADVLVANGVTLPELSAGLQTKMRALIPSYGSARNPVDITAQGVHTGGLQKTIDLLAESDEIDLIFLVTSLSSEHRKVFDVEATQAIVRARRKPILVYSYTIPSEFSRGRMAEAGLPVFSSLAAAGRACRHLLTRARFVPPAEPAPVTIDVPEDLLAKASPASGCLSEYDSKTLLRACGVEIERERLVASSEELDPAMQEVGFPLALKIQSADLPHKSDVGGVKLAVADRDTGRRAYEVMLAEVRTKRPDAAIQGVLASPMARSGVEMIVGTIYDGTFGPLVMVGLGGVMTEVYGDVVYRLAPVGIADATAMLGDLKGARLLHGFRGAAPADVAALASLIARVSAIAAALGDAVSELELNPVIVHPAGQGVTVADALVVRARLSLNPVQEVHA